MRKSIDRPPPGPEARSGRMVASAGLPLQIEVIPYESRLDRDPRWALCEGSRHFEEGSAVFDALRRIAKRLDDLGIPYAIVGGMALFRHGFRRFTEDVDILVRKDDLRRIHERLEDLGYLPPFRRSKHLRDTEVGVWIEFLTTGDYPGDGKVKPVAFPDPSSVNFESDGVRYIRLPSLIELKLDSGMTGSGRLRDLSDVLEVIKLLDLPLTFAEELHPYVRERYSELWGQARRRYVTRWRNKRLTAKAGSLANMITCLRAAVAELEAMQRDGVVLEISDGVGDDYAMLMTTDADVAKKYDMVEESEYWDEIEKEDVEEAPPLG